MLLDRRVAPFARNVYSEHLKEKDNRDGIKLIGEYQLRRNLGSLSLVGGGQKGGTRSCSL